MQRAVSRRRAAWALRLPFFCLPCHDSAKPQTQRVAPVHGSTLSANSQWLFSSVWFQVR